MDSQALKIFVEVARLGSFTAAARDLDMDPSSISRSVATLEDELGLRLFQRTTRKIALTEAGHLYLTRVASLVDELEHAREQALAVSKGATGTLRMTSSVSFGYQRLAPLLPQFYKQHPQLKLELLFTDSNLNMVNDRIDLAIRLGSKFEGDVVVTKLMSTRYRLCASPAYLERMGIPKKPQDISQHKCVLLALPEFRQEWHFKDRKGNVQSVPVQGDIQITSPLAVQRCALDGIGPALLTDWLVNDEIAQGTLVDLFPNHHVAATSFDTGVWALYPSRAYLPLKVRVMLDFLKQQFA